MSVPNRAMPAMFAAGFLVALMAGCGTHKANLPAGAQITPPQSTTQVAAEEQMRKARNLQKQQ